MRNSPDHIAASFRCGMHCPPDQVALPYFWPAICIRGPNRCANEFFLSLRFMPVIFRAMAQTAADAAGVNRCGENAIRRLAS